MLISKDISAKILTVGPSIYSKGHRGGLTNVVRSFSKYYEIFNFIATAGSKVKPIQLLYFLASIFRLFYYIFVQRIKIIHIHGSSYSSFFRKSIIINICYFFKRKIVYHLHSGAFRTFYEKPGKRGVIEKTLYKVDVLLVLSNSWKFFFSTIVDERKIYVLNNIVDKPDFKRRYLSIYTVTKFLFLGIINDSKGVFDLLDIVRDHKNELEGKFLLYVCGRGEVDRLVEYIEKYKIEHLVKFGGWVSGREKENILSVCDIYILPSYIEALPVSILEAMSYGMPVISANVGGIPEIVLNNENGFLVNPGDKKEILKKILFFINNPKAIEQMGSRSREMVKPFYPEEVILKLASIYRNLLHYDKMDFE
jgi:glycosyltransferase involved in cell wall biosynthesis